MTLTDTNLNQLIINELTQAEYDAATINPNELYIVKDGVMQSSDVINALGYTPVNKAGDTMTGNLTVSTAGASQVRLKRTDMDRSVNPSSDAGVMYYAFKDKNDLDFGNIGIERYTNGRNTIKLQAFSKDGSQSPALRINAYADNTVDCTFPKTLCCDGQWVNSNTAIISSATSLNGSGSLTYRMVLPNDGHKYEVLLRGQVTTGATSGNYVFLSCAGNEITSVTNICGAQTRASNSVQNVGSGIIIASYVASGSTNLSISKNTNFNGNVNLLTMVAYRRIGSNT